MFKGFRFGKMLPKLRLPVRIGLLVAFILTLLIYNKLSKDKKRHHARKASFEQSVSARWQQRQSNKKYLVNDENCDILEMNPWDSSVLEFMEKPEIEIGPCPEKSLTVSTKDKMFRYSKFAAEQYVEPCSFREIHRISQDSLNYTKKADSQIRKSPSKIIPKSLKPETKATSEFLEITCPLSKHDKNKSRTHYEAIVFPPTAQSLKTKAKTQFWKNLQPVPSGVGVYEGNGSDDAILNGRQNLNLPPSVLIIGLNSVSRLHMIRSMPQTVKFLNENQFVEMLGYTKIHQDTFGNLMSVLLGADPLEMTCRVDNERKHDNCPFIWKKFSERNYVTALLEDVGKTGVFNEGKTGFVEQPTDYYFRPMALEFEKNLDEQKCGVDGGETQFLLKYIKEFVAEMSGTVPYFLLSWFSSIGSEKMNFLQTLDSTFLEFISQTLKITGNNTIIIFMSDHGYKYGKFRETFLGFYEEALPTFFIRLPPTLQRSQPSWYLNLIDNSARLTSPLNLHATLADVLSLSNLPETETSQGQGEDLSGDSKLSLFIPVKPNSTKLYSLFEELPQNLSCDTCGIPPESCRCNVHPEKGGSSNIAKQFALVVLQKINRIIEDEIDSKKCAVLTLSQILYVHQVWEGRKEVPYWSEKLYYNDYIIGLEALPSKAHYETKIHAMELFKFKIEGLVSRISKGDASTNECVKDPLKKLYCFCI